MRILIAVHGFPPLQVSGAERTAERYAHWLVDHGQEVEVFSIGRLDSNETRLDTFIENSLTVHRLSYDIQGGEDPFRNTYDFPPVGAALRQVLAKKDFDLVHLVSGYLFAGQVIDTAHELHLPVVLTLTEYYYICARLNLMHVDSTLCEGPDSDEKCTRCLLEDKRRYRYPAAVAPGLMDGYWSLAMKNNVYQNQVEAIKTRRETLKSVLSAADLVICPSRFIIQKYAEYGIDTSAFQFNQHGLTRPGYARPPRPDGQCLRIGYIGQIKEHKGVDLLVDAAIALIRADRPVQVAIWGREKDAPDYYKNLQRRSRAYPQVAWRGGFDGNQVWDVLSEIDVLVVPSRWYENCPSVILEAFRMGVPVMTTNIGGMAELVQHEKNGLLFELNDAQDLARQLQRLIDDPALLQQVRDGIPYVKTSEEEVNQIFQSYQHVLATWNG